MIPYVFLAISIFYSICIISYLLHVNDKFPDEAAPDANQIIDVFVFLLFSMHWAFTIWLLKTH